MLGHFIMWPTVMTASAKAIMASVSAMEARDGLEITTLNKIGRTLMRDISASVQDPARPADTYVSSAPAISPDVMRWVGGEDHFQDEVEMALQSY